MTDQEIRTKLNDIILSDMEYYNRFTGEGNGARDFTWSGLIVDMMNKEYGERSVINAT